MSPASTGSARSILASGTYKPQIHTHYLPHLSLSYARHTNSLNATFLLLSTDYSKSLHLQTDRSLEFHTPNGCHYTTRLPRYGRDLKYDTRSAEALLPAVGINENGMAEVFRLNLEVGRYMRSYEVDVGGDSGGARQGGIEAGSVNVASIASKTHNLLALGTSLGTTEFWDPRSHSRIGILQPPPSIGSINGRHEITAVEFSHSGLGIATGSSKGLIHLYDLRSPTPILKKDQGYGYPIHTLTYLDSSTATRAQTSEPKILSSDKRIIKIWDARDGTPWTSVEPAVDINSVAWCQDSGMLLTANEGRQQHSFFIPQLGPAPRWCSFLDNLVEEMAEDPNDPNAFTSRKAGDVYDNYKFLTIAQLESLNLSHLIGTTSLLRPYMHGYFVAQRLYEEAKLIADPFVWEEQRNKRVKEKIDTERESRIRGTKKATAKVNKRLAEKMLERQEREERRQARRVLEKAELEEHPDNAVAAGEQGPAAGDHVEMEDDRPPAKPGNLLADPRFARLFEDEDFAIDETSREFQSLNPSTKILAIKSTTNAASGESKLTAVEEEALQDIAHSDSDASTSSSLSDHAPKAKTTTTNNNRISSTSYKKSGHRPQQQQQQVQAPQMKIHQSSHHSTTQPRDRSFGSRASRSTKDQQQQQHRGTTTNNSSSTVVGEREIRFAPAAKGQRKRDQQQQAGDLDPGKGRRDKDRRSASGNVFRNM